MLADIRRIQTSNVTDLNATSGDWQEFARALVFATLWATLAIGTVQSHMQNVRTIVPALCIVGLCWICLAAYRTEVRSAQLRLRARRLSGAKASVAHEPPRDEDRKLFESYRLSEFVFRRRVWTLLGRAVARGEWGLVFVVGVDADETPQYRAPRSAAPMPLSAHFDTAQILPLQLKPLIPVILLAFVALAACIWPLSAGVGMWYIAVLPLMFTWGRCSVGACHIARHLLRVLRVRSEKEAPMTYIRPGNTWTCSGGIALRYPRGTRYQVQYFWNSECVLVAAAYGLAPTLSSLFIVRSDGTWTELVLPASAVSSVIGVWMMDRPIESRDVVDLE